MLSCLKSIPHVCCVGSYRNLHRTHVSLCCFKRSVICLISTQSSCVNCFCICFSNERRIEELKNEYESKTAEREANKNGGLNLDEVREKHSKELAEIKVC